MKKLTIILLGLAIISCQDIENCDTNDDLDFMVVRFYDIESESSKKVGFTITAENSPYSFTPFTDSTGVGLPLNPEDTTTTFFFDSDTSHFELEISYDELQVTIFDPQCDPSYTFIGIDTVRQTFDSTVVVGTVTNRQISTNVEIYF
ncbi:hypothetical protein [Ekhidna sp. To15]|uniref:hypothetical protein n=1 Tax=Ekhidna sp. To15 TaxID=3395267 RepID=UPI003F51CB09